MRLSCLLLSMVVVPAAVLAAPVATPASAAPRPVPPSVQELPLDGLSSDGLSSDYQALAVIGTHGPRTVVLTEQRSTRPFSTVGLTWAPDPDVGEVDARVRTRTDGAWTAWTEVEAEGQEVLEGTPDAGRPQARPGTAPVYVGPSDGVQVRLDVGSGAAPTDVRLSLVDPGESPADAVSAPRSVAGAATTRPTIRSRADWGADESMRGQAPGYSETLQAAIIHHTAGRSDYTEAEVPAIMRGIYAFHVQSRGWSDVGYNVLVDKFGTAWEGRWGGLHRPVIGAHAGGFNGDTVGISMIGNFADEVPSAATQETVAQVAAWKLGIYGREPGGNAPLTSAGGGTSRHAAGQRVVLPRVFAHRDVGNTSCPGNAGYSVLPSIRERVRELVEAAPLSIEPLGALEAVTAPFAAESVLVSGWAVDPDASGPVEVAVSTDGVERAPAPVTELRPDITDPSPYPLRSGFALRLPASPGPHAVCVRLVNQARGSDLDLGCTTAVVEARPAPPDARSTDDACPPGRVPSAGFSDTSDSVHRAAIDCVVWWGVARGRGDGTYSPARPVTRGQMASFLARTVLTSGGSLPAAPPDAFDDDAGQTAEVRLAIDQLAAVGVVRGRAARTFDPAGLVTRGQMASFLVAAHEYRSGARLPEGGDYFTDDDADAAHRVSIAKAALAGLTGGTGGTTYSPGASTSRGQMAAFLSRTLDLLVETG